MKNARIGQAEIANCFPLAAGLSAAVTLAMLPLASQAGKPADKRPDYSVGYTVHRTDLPSYFANRATSRAFVVRGDGSGTTELAPELVTKPHQHTQFGGWSPDGRQAILSQMWNSPENGAWEDKHGLWRHSAEHWLQDMILLDMETKKTANITAVERVSFYNSGVHFWPEKQFSFSAMIDEQLRPFRMDPDGRNKKPVTAGPGFIYGVSPSPDGKRICYHRDYRLNLAGALPDKERQFFVTQEVTRRVLEACPDAEWRLIVALSRCGGLRCPSEHLSLTRPDVDWGRGRFLVTSPKTEHHDGKGERWVPIFSELRPYLEEAFELAKEGASDIITGRRNVRQNLRTRFRKIIRRAALTPWPKLFQNLRASRETELAAVYPGHVVCAWIGNSTLIAKKNYLQVTEADFQRGAESRAVAVQKAVQQSAASDSTDSQASLEVVGVATLDETVRFDARDCGIKEYAWRDSNPQPTAP